MDSFLGSVFHRGKEVVSSFLEIKNHSDEFQKLPDEVLLHIFCFLSVRDYSRLSLTCKRWYRVTQEQALWRIFLRENQIKIQKKKLPSSRVKTFFSREKNKKNSFKRRVWKGRSGSLGGGVVHCAAFSKNDRYLLTGLDGRIKLWDLKKPFFRREGYYDVFKELYINSFSDGRAAYVGNTSFCFFNGNTFLSSGSDEKIKIWTVYRFRKILKSLEYLKGHKKRVTGLGTLKSELAPIIVSGSLDKTIKLWDKKTRNCLSTLKGSDKIQALRCSSSQPYCLSAEGKAMKLWDCSAGRSLHIFEGHKKNVIDMYFLPHYSPLLLSGSIDGTLRLWNSRTGKIVRSFFAPNGQIESMSLSSCGNYFLVGESNRYCEWYRESKKIFTKGFANFGTSSVQYSSQGRSFLTGGWSGFSLHCVNGYLECP